MNNVHLVFVFAIVLLLTATSAHGDESTVEATPFSFYAFEPSKLVNQDEYQTRAYRVALGPYKKRENRWQPESLIRLAGQVYKETHEIPAGFNEEEVFEFYREQLPSGVEVLYQCERRACGESNNWANDHFRVKQLYGINQYQFYSVYQLDSGEHIVLYVIRRGNRRTYVQLEILAPNKASER